MVIIAGDLYERAIPPAEPVEAIGPTQKKVNDAISANLADHQGAGGGRRTAGCPEGVRAVEGRSKNSGSCDDSTRATTRLNLATARLPGLGTDRF
jgi:hypothetical protein